MPELPEVETFVRALRQGRNLGSENEYFPSLQGQTIVDLWSDYPKTLAPNQELFQTNVVGRQIKEITRRGKYIVFVLDKGLFHIHLRMSGRLSVSKLSSPRPKHVHVCIMLSSGYCILFDDARKFGRCTWSEDQAALNEKLGIEPFDGLFDGVWLMQHLKKTKRAIKAALLDQSIIAGIGNIYADEALWRARINPLHQASSLSFEQCSALQESIVQALSDGIKHGGAAIDWVYPGGKFQDQFTVYGRTGQACKRCNGAIVRTVVAQRGTHFCPNCQPQSTSTIVTTLS